jgi:superfamily II DNA/RNA helicase
LSYVLPLLKLIKENETAEEKKLENRPQAIILVPSKELGLFDVN